jgi:ADP-heptose:LPS heptosyltransferase
VRLLGFDEVRVIRTSRWLWFVRDTLAAVAWGRGRRFDVSHDLEFLSNYSAIMSVLINARVRVGFSTSQSSRGRQFTHPVPYYPSQHVLEAFLSQVGMNQDDLRHADLAVLPLPPEADPEAESLLQRVGLWGAPKLVAINVNTGKLSGLQMWSLAYHSILAVRLHESHRAAVAFIGSESERLRIEEVLGALPRGVRAANLAGLTRVEILLAVLKRADLLVSNESGPLNLAALVGTPTVGFFGAGAARIYGPRGARSLNLDREEEPRCKACQELPGSGGDDCPFGNRCMSVITPERAFEAAAKLLGEPVD